MELQKKLLSGLFWVMLLNLMIKPLWILGIERGVQNAVGVAEYGLYFTLFNISYIFNILLDLGVTNFNTRNIAQSPWLIGKHLSHIFTLKLAMVGLYVIVTFTIGGIRGFSSREFWLLSFLCLNQFLNSMILYLRSNFEGLLLFKWDSVLSVLDRLLMIVICGALLIGLDGFRVEWFVWAQTISYGVAFALAFVVLVRKVGLKGLNWNKAFSAAVLKKSFPFALLVLLMASYNRMDPVLLDWLLPDGQYQAGIYAEAFRLLDALTMIAYLVSVPLLPIYSKLTAKGLNSKDEVGKITKMVLSMVIVFAVAAAITFSYLSTPLMDLMYFDHVEESAAVFKVLIYGIIPISFTYIFGTLLTANGSLRQLNVLALMALVVNIVVNVVLIPRMAALGSAWASLIAQSFMALTQMLLALKIFDIWPKFGYVIQLFLYVIVIIVANVLCLHAMAWLTHLLVLIVVALAAGFGMRLIDAKELKQLIKEK